MQQTALHTVAQVRQVESQGEEMHWTSVERGSDSRVRSVPVRGKRNIVKSFTMSE